MRISAAGRTAHGQWPTAQPPRVARGARSVAVVHSRSIALLTASVLLTCALSGCAESLESRNFQSRLIAAPPDEVFQAAQVILRREFGSLTVEPEARRLVTRPVEYRTVSDSGTARDLYRGRSTMRRIAHFTAAPRDGQTLARLRIEVERQDTARREVFQPESHRLSDAPGHTAIERDAATTTEQNTVWTPVRRDLRLERQLLAELEELFAPEPEGTPATRPAADVALPPP